MAHFIGYVHGARGSVSRLGHKSSGLSVTARGWNIGGRVEVLHDATIGDTVNFYVDNGSNGAGLVACFRRATDGTIEPCTSIGTTLNGSLTRWFQDRIDAIRRVTR